MTARATPEGTRRASARWATRALGQTGLVVAPIGIGTHRLRDDDVLHARALRMAIDGGLNLLDTSARDRDGSSQRLVGRVLGEALRAGLDRAGIVVVAELAAPLDQALADARERLGVELDVALLRIPAEPEPRARLGDAFAWLDAATRAGTIATWGVASDGPVLDDLLDHVRERCGDAHRLGVVRLPLNALELGSLTTIRAATAAGLGVLVDRPLTARITDGAAPVRLAEPTGEDPAVASALARVRKLEAEWAGDLGRRIRTEAGDATDLFRWGQALARSHAADMGAWQRLRHDVIAPHVGQASAALLAHLEGSDREAFARWWQAYGTALFMAFTAIEARLTSTPPHRRIADAIDPLLPPAWQALPLAARAVGVALSAPVASVVVGMRSPSAVAQMLALADAPAIAVDLLALAPRTAAVVAQLARENRP